MSDWKKFCDQLGVPEDAPTRMIRRTFRKEALKRHPDKHGGKREAVEDFRKLNEAYKFLLAHEEEERRRRDATPQFVKPAAPPAPKVAPESPKEVRSAASAQRAPLPRWLLVVAVILLLGGVAALLPNRHEAPGSEPAPQLPATVVTLPPEAVPDRGFCELELGASREDAGYFTKAECGAACDSRARVAEASAKCTWRGESIEPLKIDPALLKTCKISLEKKPYGERMGVLLDWEAKLTAEECRTAYGIQAREFRERHGEPDSTSATYDGGYPWDAETPKEKKP